MFKGIICHILPFLASCTLATKFPLDMLAPPELYLCYSGLIGIIIFNVIINRLPRKRLDIINRLYAVPPGAYALGGKSE